MLYRSRGDDRPADLVSAGRTDVLRRVEGGWLLAVATSSSTRRCSAPRTSPCSCERAIRRCAVRLDAFRQGRRVHRRRVGHRPGRRRRVRRRGRPRRGARARPRQVWGVVRLRRRRRRRARRRHDARRQRVARRGCDRALGTDRRRRHVRRRVRPVHTAGRDPRRSVRRRVRRGVRPQREEPPADGAGRTRRTSRRRGVRSSSRCRAPASTRAAAGRCTSDRSSRSAGSSCSWPTSWHPTCASTVSRPAGRLRPTCAARAASASTANGSTTGPVGSSSSRHARRFGVALTGADHAGAYVFLASDAARGMTGEIVRSDGGLGVR